MNLIEDKHTLHFFVKSKPTIDLLIPVWSSHRAHPLMSRISFVYYREENGNDGIININHIDAKKIEKFDLNIFISETTKVLGSRYISKLGLDYEWVYFESYGKPFIFEEFVESVYRGYRRDFKELNDCVPLMKWYEVLKTIPTIQNINDWDYKYSSAIRNLGRLEGAGVKVEEEKFIDSFNFDASFLKRGLVYTQYNPYTLTGRPSNRHLGVNYSALPKADGSRESFVSRNPKGTLLQFDYESYHLRLIGGMIGFKLPTDISAHQYFAEIYGCDYETSKAITFKYLYGGLDDAARSIPFFKKVEEYIQSVYQKFVISGRLTTPLYKREIHFGRIEGATEQKVFNYLLQALETEINYMKMDDIFKCFEGKMSKPILYTYDAFLIDLHPIERDEIISSVKSAMERGGFPVRVYEGSNYNNLEVIN